MAAITDMRKHQPTGIAIAIVCAVLAGCGGDDDKKRSKPVVIDPAKVEKGIEKSVRDQRDISAKATCPANVKIKKGSTFKCTAESARQVATFLVTQRDDRGNVSYKAVPPFVEKR